MILLASSLSNRCAAAFKLAMFCDSPAALAGADAVSVGVDCLSLVLTLATIFPDQRCRLAETHGDCLRTDNVRQQRGEATQAALVPILPSFLGLNYRMQ
jgi:hypothetical protein